VILSAPPGRAQANEPRANNLTLRVASAAVLAPVTLAITYWGGFAFYALCALSAAGILWEWVSLVSHRADARVLAPGWLSLLGAMLLIGVGWPATGIGAVAAGTLAAACVVAGFSRATDEASAPAWAAFGVIYAAALLVAPSILRSDPQWGLPALLFLFADVWATDIFAFFCGRAIGGPLLWPRVSPKKTWAGAVGGLAGGVAASLAVAYASGIGNLGIVGLVACILSVLAQAGDLLESAVKRRFGAKDASHLIPGHGGLMDRLDGFICATLAALVIGLIHQGIAAPARGLLVW
jgi:phosphatidate cytidylyltransferase